MRPFWVYFLVAFIPISLGVAPLHSAAASTPTQGFALRAATATIPPRIDGALGDPLWRHAAHVRLAWDFTYRRPAEESTDVYLLADARFLYVAFIAVQSGALTATQHTNDVPLTTDDAVTVSLWPGGRNGFEYGFSANPIGAHDAFSSENSAFAPGWSAVGRRNAHGYVITERIPLDVLRGDGRDMWLVQFSRVVQVTSVTYEWAHNSAQGATDDANYAGHCSEWASQQGAREPNRACNCTRSAKPRAKPLVAARRAPVPISPCRLREPHRFSARCSRLFERRARSADDRANGLPASVPRGSPVLHAGERLLQQSQLS